MGSPVGQAGKLLLCLGTWQSLDVQCKVDASWPSLRNHLTHLECATWWGLARSVSHMLQHPPAQVPAAAQKVLVAVPLPAPTLLSVEKGGLAFHPTLWHKHFVY